MSGSENDNKTFEKSFVNQTQIEEPIDEELLALSPPPPSLKHAVIVGIILVLSILLMVTFFEDLKYLLKGLSGPVKVGEVDQIYYDELDHNSFVELQGIPNIARSILANEGVKWFAMSDNSHKWFSLSGKQRLLVNWTISDEEKAFRDPSINPTRLNLPYNFKGQLLRTESLKSNYTKILLYFECLDLYTMRECKYCLGLDDMDVCREAFTCIENKSPQECSEPPPGLKKGSLTGDVLARAIAELEIRGLNIQKTINERRKLILSLKNDLSDIKNGTWLTRLSGETKSIKKKIAQAKKSASEALNKLAKQGLDLAKAKVRVSTLLGEITTKSREINDLELRFQKPKKLPTERSVDGGIAEGLTVDAGMRPLDSSSKKSVIADMDPSEVSDIKDKLRIALKEKKLLQKNREALREQINDINDFIRVIKEREQSFAASTEEIKSVKSGVYAKNKERLIALLLPNLISMEATEPSLKQLQIDIKDANSDNLDDLYARMDDIKDAVGPGTWVLIDGETPIEKIWVLLVYLVLLTMTAFNVRRLLQFIAAWRA